MCPYFTSAVLSTFVMHFVENLGGFLFLEKKEGWTGISLRCMNLGDFDKLGDLSILSCTKGRYAFLGV